MAVHTCENAVPFLNQSYTFIGQYRWAYRSFPWAAVLGEETTIVCPKAVILAMNTTTPLST